MQRLRELRQYVTDLNSIPRLSDEETRQLTSRLMAAKQGTLSPEQATQAKQQLIEGHLWLAVRLVKRSGARLRSLSPLDLVQQGNLGLLRALERFDFASGSNFTSYASTTIYYAILDALPMENTIQLSQHLTWRNRSDERIEALRALQPLSLEAMHGEEDCAFADLLAAPPFVLPDPAAETEEEQRQQAKRAQVEALLVQLTPREQQMLRLRYGLSEADGRCHAPSAIARQLGLDCSTVCNLERGALRKLRALQDPQQAHARLASPRLALPRSRKRGGRSRRNASKPPAPSLRRKVSRSTCELLPARRMSIRRSSRPLCGCIGTGRAANRNAWRPPVPHSKPKASPSRWRGCAAGRMSGAGLLPPSCSTTTPLSGRSHVQPARTSLPAPRKPLHKNGCTRRTRAWLRRARRSRRRACDKRPGWARMPRARSCGRNAQET
jgi:RNA polymerase sigma factor (sigma-70 family)